MVQKNAANLFLIVISGKVYCLYSVYILSILLYGSECWSLKDVQYRKLRAFYRLCVRKMCRITMRQTQKYHIKADDNNKKLAIHSFHYYYHTAFFDGPDTWPAWTWTSFPAR